jgi:hypothetical protein
MTTGAILASGEEEEEEEEEKDGSLFMLMLYYILHAIYNFYVHFLFIYLYLVTMNNVIFHVFYLKTILYPFQEYIYCLRIYNF